MVRNNNNLKADLNTPSNGHALLNGNAATPTAAALSWRQTLWNSWDAFIDVLWFIICSIGFILQITLLINNAGVVSGLNLLDTPDHLIERSFNVNVMSHFWTTKAFLPKMIENERGHIASIASLAGHVGISKLVDYCASKFAAVGFDESLRLELEVLGHTNIKTTCICPFFIQATGMFDDVNARWVPTLNADEVADRIIIAIKKNEKLAVIPGFLKVLLPFKWAFPWGCVGGLLRRLVPDASPKGLPSSSHSASSKPNGHIIATNNNNNNNSSSADLAALNAQLTSASATLPAKSPSMLIQRTPSLGERVL
ncbi:CG9265 [Drosophila busckii]|uniref:CG9265 n=1 Tax=Drosophila busckii TaxID=30019 RepID=A0A0M4EAG1_DROBS|nr:CG9265 [Drosophila busckii]